MRLIWLHFAGVSRRRSGLVGGASLQQLAGRGKGGQTDLQPRVEKTLRPKGVN